MARVAVRACADRPVGIRAADRMTLQTSARLRDRTLERADRVRRAIDGAGMVLLCECDLFRLEVHGTSHRRPRRRGVPAAQELAIFGGVTARAIRRGQIACEREAAMRVALLRFGRTVAIEAVHSPRGVTAHLVLVHDRRRLARVTLGAFAGGAHAGGGGLLGFDTRPQRVDDERRHDQRDGDDDSDENGSKGSHVHLSARAAQSRARTGSAVNSRPSCPHGWARVPPGRAHASTLR